MRLEGVAVVESTCIVSKGKEAEGQLRVAGWGQRQRRAGDADGESAETWDR